MAIEFKCVCGKAFRVDDARAGQRGTCPQCKMPITVPGEPPAVEDAPEARFQFPREKLMGYLQQHESSNIFILHPHIPAAREKRAREEFGIDPGDGILGVFHAGLLVGEEETMVLTESGFYVRKADLARSYGSYESLIEGSIHLEGTRDLVIQAVKPERYRYRVLVPPGIAEYLSKILRGLQLLLNNRDPAPIFAGQSGANALQELRAERQGLLPTATMQGSGSASGGGTGRSGKRGLLGAFRGKKR